MNTKTVILDGPSMKINKIITKKKKNSANTLTKNIIETLNKLGCHAERVNNISRKIKGRYVKSNMMRGTADIHAIIKGRAVMIEVKIGKDTQSIYQKIYQKSVEKSEGIYYIAKDYKDFLFWLKIKFRL